MIELSFPYLTDLREQGLGQSIHCWMKMERRIELWGQNVTVYHEWESVWERL